MERGYVKLYRAIDQNELLENDNTALVVFIKLLTRVDRRTGSYKTGRFKLAHLCNLRPSTLRDALKRLEAATVIRQQSDSRATTIYICNWSKYQQGDDSSPSAERRFDDTKQEKKEKENIDTNVSMAVQPVNKKQISLDIDEAFAEWVRIHDYEIQAKVTNNRRAASNLIKKYGINIVKQHIMVAHLANLDQYSKIRTSDFVELQANTNKLSSWVKTTNKKQVIKPKRTGVIL